MKQLKPVAETINAEVMNVKLTPLDKVSAQKLITFFEKKTHIEGAQILVEIIKGLGNPITLLEHDLHQLNKYNIGEDEKDIIACSLLLAQTFTNVGNREKWKKELAIHYAFLTTDFAKANPNIFEEVAYETLRLSSSLNHDSITDAFVTISHYMGDTGKMEKSAIISEIFCECNIVKQGKFETIKEAQFNGIMKTNYTYAHKRIYQNWGKSQFPKAEQMKLNTLKLIEQESFLKTK